MKKEQLKSVVDKYRAATSREKRLGIISDWVGGWFDDHDRQLRAIEKALMRRDGETIGIEVGKLRVVSDAKFVILADLFMALTDEQSNMEPGKTTRKIDSVKYAKSRKGKSLRPGNSP